VAVPFYTLIAAQINQINAAKSMGQTVNVDAAERRRSTISALDWRGRPLGMVSGAVDVALDRSHRNDDRCPLAENALPAQSSRGLPRPARWRSLLNCNKEKVGTVAVLTPLG
jgi:hypothetical protein